MGSFEKTFIMVQTEVKKLAERLIELELQFNLSASGASANESSDPQNKNPSGKFWDEIDRNNIFLQDLK